MPRQPRQKLKRKSAATEPPAQPAPVPPPLRATALPMSSPLGPQPHLTPLLDMSELLMGDSAHAAQAGSRPLHPNPDPDLRPTADADAHAHPHPHPHPHLPPQEAEADFVRQYRAAHEVVRGLIEARLRRAELPLAEEQRDALNEQLQLSSAASRGPSRPPLPPPARPPGRARPCPRPAPAAPGP